MFYSLACHKVIKSQNGLFGIEQVEEGQKYKPLSFYGTPCIVHMKDK